MILSCLALLLDVHTGSSVEGLFQLLLFLLIFSVPVLLGILVMLKSKAKNKKNSKKEK